MSQNKSTPYHKKPHKRKTRRAAKIFKEMNCAPTVANQRAVPHSCFTPMVLQQIKTAYNQHHPANPIQSTNPTEIWSELKSRLTTCSSEDCWLSEIKNKEARNYIDSTIFAPDHPSKWKKDPNTWLSNYDIYNVLKQYEVPYKQFHMIQPSPIDFDATPSEMNGSCVEDELCKFSIREQLANGKTKIGMIFNLDDHKKSGSHWVSMFLDLEDNFVFFLDSTGESIPNPIYKLVYRIIKEGLTLSPPKQIHFYENCPVEHQYSNTECGMYGLFFIITMLTGKADTREFSTFIDKIMFFKDRRIPDKYMTKLRKRYFNTPP